MTLLEMDSSILLPSAGDGLEGKEPFFSCSSSIVDMFGGVSLCAFLEGVAEDVDDMIRLSLVSVFVDGGGYSDSLYSCDPQTSTSDLSGISPQTVFSPSDRSRIVSLQQLTMIRRR